MCRGRRARILLHLHIQREKIVLRGCRAGRRFGCRNNPSCVYVLGRRTRGGETGAPLDLKMPLENGHADERVSRCREGGTLCVVLPETTSRGLCG